MWDPADADEEFASLQNNILSDVSILRGLQRHIDELFAQGARAVQKPSPLSPASLLGPHQPTQADRPAGVGTSSNSTEAHIAVLDPDNYIALPDLDVQEAGLCARLRRKRKRRTQRGQRGQSTSAVPAFSLQAVSDQLTGFVADASQTALELPPFTKLQRQQVRALAAVFGLEPRACGRAGQTLFKTERTGPLSAEGEAQVQRLVAYSTDYGRASAELRHEMQAALTPSVPLAAPLDAANKGSQMLRQMGWAEGTGLGAQGQGITEPVAVARRKGRCGLGH